VRAVFDAYVDADERTQPAQKLASKTIVEALKYMADRPWNELGRNAAPITQHKLGRMLKAFQINSHGSIRTAASTSKGYERAAFEEAWKRYLSPDVANQTGTPAQPAESVASGLFQTGTNDTNVPVSKWRKATESATCAGVPVSKAAAGAKSEKSNGAASGDAAPTVANVPFMITNAMEAELRKRGVHPGVIRELRPEDAHRLLDKSEPIRLNAERSPEQDLSKLAATLAGQDSTRLAREAMRFAAPGIKITPGMIDAIKTGSAVAYPVRDALWIALS
jgi:Protein of unknown function (DUF3631)